MARDLTEEEAAQRIERLMAVIFATRFEKALDRCAYVCWLASEHRPCTWLWRPTTGPVDWIGDRIEQFRLVLQRRRADRGRATVGFDRIRRKAGWK